MHCCPNCGINLKRYEALPYGNVMIDDVGDIHFNGHQVRGFPNVLMTVVALIRGYGRPFNREALQNVMGSDGYDRTIDVYVSRARRYFRMIDPSFDQIEAVRGIGYRWRFKPGQYGMTPPQLVAA